MTVVDRLRIQIETWEEAHRVARDRDERYGHDMRREIIAEFQDRAALLRIRLKQAERAKPCDPGISDKAYGDGRL